MAFDPRKPYNDLPALPPQAEVESRVILKACIEARAAVAELKQAGALIPNQAVLINSIPMLEAQASSEIENIVTATDRLFQFVDDRDSLADPATKEALRYRTALREGFESLGHHPLTTRTAIDICRTIKGVDIDIRKTPGTALMNDRSGEVIYTAPEGEARIRDKLANWEHFLHEAEHIDPLVRMVIGHYQFEAIHPFVDGNGRTGRVLNLLYLVEQGLLDIPVLYLSKAIIEAKQDYYRLLLNVSRDAAWEPWILFMLDAVRSTAQWTTSRNQAIRALIDETAERMKRDAPGIYSRELTELIFVQPYCRIANVVDADIAQRQTASVYLKQLVDIGLLHEVKSGREKLSINPGLLRTLQSFDRE
ncbi:MAG: Fic family protein [Betaproteobacteria bacterium]|nr:MAG: Fic family protein [Betaproteobacteria bacterium]